MLLTSGVLRRVSRQNAGPRCVGRVGVDLRGTYVVWGNVHWRVGEMKNNKEDSVKYNTRPIDYTGCHPVIAEHLKLGEEIKCWVWDKDYDEKPNSCCEVWIVRYWQTAAYPYRTAGDTYFRYAEPIPIKVRRIMPPERAIPVLIAGGWKFSADGHLVGPEQTLVPSMLCCMGKLINDPAVIPWSWPPCIIEECDE